VLTRKNNLLQSYVNGSPVGGTFSVVANQHTANPLVIGGIPGGSGAPYNGQILLVEAAVGEAWTAANILDSYNNRYRLITNAGIVSVPRRRTTYGVLSVQGGD